MLDQILKEFKEMVEIMVKEGKTGNIEFKVNVVNGSLSKKYNAGMYESRMALDPKNGEGELSELRNKRDE